MSKGKTIAVYEARAHRIVGQAGELETILRRMSAERMLVTNPREIQPIRLADGRYVVDVVSMFAKAPEPARPWYRTKPAKVAAGVLAPLAVLFIAGWLLVPIVTAALSGAVSAASHALPGILGVLALVWVVLSVARGHRCGGVVLHCNCHGRG